MEKEGAPSLDSEIRSKTLTALVFDEKRAVLLCAVHDTSAVNDT